LVLIMLMLNPYHLTSGARARPELGPSIQTCTMPQHLLFPPNPQHCTTPWYIRIIL
jgi:hypothetical protein